MSTPEAVRSKATIRLLGRFEVVVDGASVEDSAWRGRKAQQLVKILAVAPGRSLHREQVADLLWPDLDADAADRQLHKAIHAARRALEPTLGSGADSAWLVSQDRTVALSPAIVIDADVAEADAEAALASRDVSACEAALESFVGPLLPADLYDDWSESRRARLSMLHVRLLASVAEGSLTAGGTDRAADAANRLLAIDAADERAHRVLMHVASASGDRSAVVRQFRACEAALAAELGVEPSETTRALYQELVERSADNAVGDSKAIRESARPTASVGELEGRSSISSSQEASPSLAGSRFQPARAGFQVPRSAILGVTVLAALVAVFFGVRAVRPGFPATGPSAPPVVTLTGGLPGTFVRVSLAKSDSGWSSFTDSQGRFVLRDTSLREGQSIELVIESGGAGRRVAIIQVPQGDESGSADLGLLDVASMRAVTGDSGGASDRVVPFERGNVEWYRGVAAAVTTGSTTDRERITALHDFVARRYARPSDNGATDTPRRTIEAGTLYSGPLPLALATLTRAAGYETRLVTVSAPRPVEIEHTVVEVFYDGRWHLFDPAFGVVAINDIGEVANLEDLVRHPTLVDRMPYAAANRPGWRGAEIPGLLRSGVHRIAEMQSPGR